MPRAIEHEFIDLAKPAAPRADDEQGRMSRRSFLAAATAVASVTAMSGEAFARNFGPDAEPVRYPEPDVVPLDSRFKYKLGNTPILRLFSSFNEGGADCPPIVFTVIAAVRASARFNEGGADCPPIGIYLIRRRRGDALLQ